jgi:hypothetical protein
MNAYGIRLGSEFHWKLGCTRLSLFGRGAGSILVATAGNSGSFIGNETLIAQRDDVHVVPVLEVAAGLSWCYKNLEVSSGYELAAWFNQAQTYTYSVDADGSGGFTRSYADTLLDGFFARVCYRF